MLLLWNRCLIGFLLAWVLGSRVQAQPEFVLQPQSQTVQAGANVTFTADVDGVPPILVLWFKDGQPLADGGRIQGVSTLQLSISQVTSADAGVYELAAEDFFGDISVSDPAMLTVTGGGGVTVPPQITTQPASQTVAPGGQVTFTVSATGSDPLVYQWRFKTFDIPGATGPALALRDLQAANAGEYRVVVSNSAGSVTSVPAILTVTSGGGPGPDPGVFRIVAQPQKLEVQAGNPATFTVAASGAPNVTYQWRKEGVDITGATQPTYRLPKVVATDAGAYSAQVRAGTNQLTSEVAVLTVAAPLPAPADNTWTILVYGHGDHNLSPSLITDINEMEAVGSGAGFNIVVQADFNAQEQRLDGLPNDLHT